MSRNKREGHYHGKYAAPYKIKHWRGPFNGSLKEYPKWVKHVGLMN